MRFIFCRLIDASVCIAKVGATGEPSGDGVSWVGEGGVAFAGGTVFPTRSIGGLREPNRERHDRSEWPVEFALARLELEEAEEMEAGLAERVPSRLRFGFGGTRGRASVSSSI